MASLLVGISQAEELRIGRYFSDGMVLQREKPNVIRGTAPAGAEVQVLFSGQEKTGKADETGLWQVTLDPMPASAKGAELAVKSGKERAVIKDVVVGDVILFARQTSIDISLGRDDEGRKAAAAHKKNANYRAIVIRTVPAPRPQAPSMRSGS